MREVRKILIFRNGRIGDVLMVTGVATFLHKAFPGAQIDLAVPEWVSGVTGSQEGFHRVIPFEYTFSWFKRLRISWRLRRHRYDLIIPLEQANRPTKSAFFWGGRFRFSFSNKYSALMTAHLRYVTETHETVNSLRLLQLALAYMHKAGYRIENYDACMAHNFLPPVLHFGTEEKTTGLALLSDFGIDAGRPFIVLHPFNSLDAPLRRWPLKNYETLARLLTSLGFQVLFSGYGPEIAAVEPIMENLRNTPETVSLTRRNISARERGAILSMAQGLVVSDGSPMHLAVAVGVPLIALFGFSAANRTGPAPGNSPFMVITASYPCSPCMYQASREREKCEQQGFGDCMTAIGPEKVKDSLLSLMAASARQA
ncbi:MAG: glycosyltransferase family 9 protein [Turneriella sp.]|nr:glycosyltransferase family 9 protein [Turneriella sp.]